MLVATKQELLLWNNPEAYNCDVLRMQSEISPVWAVICTWFYFDNNSQVESLQSELFIYAVVLKLWSPDQRINITRKVITGAIFGALPRYC